MGVATVQQCKPLQAVTFMKIILTAILLIVLIPNMYLISSWEFFPTDIWIVALKRVPNLLFHESYQHFT